MSARNAHETQVDQNGLPASSVHPDRLAAAAPQALAEVDLDFLGKRIRGKVRDIYEPDIAGAAASLVLVTTDRISAFDRVLGLVPFRGQVLNQLSAFWFGQVADIVDSHLLETPDPNVTVARKCEPLTIEVVVRGYLTGVTDTSVWRQYEAGQREIYGLPFPDGMVKNQALPEPIITPTTKAAAGEHDVPVTSDQVVDEGHLDRLRWDEVRNVALALFARGSEIAREAGLVLVDTKYEFGLDDDGTLVLIDEVHTPDSSRYWVESTLDTRRAGGLEPENADKEVLRLEYAELGYTGHGDPPDLPTPLALKVAGRYLSVFERLTGTSFVPGEYPAAPRIEAAMRQWWDDRP